MNIINSVEKISSIRPSIKQENTTLHKEVHHLKNVLLFATTLLVISNLVLTFLVLSERKSYRSALDTTYSSISTFKKLIDIKDPNDNYMTFRSKYHGFEITYDKTVWEPIGYTSLSDTKYTTYYTLTAGLGSSDSSTVQIIANAPSYLESLKSQDKYKNLKGDLEVASKAYLDFKISNERVKVNETVTRGSRTYQKILTESAFKFLKEETAIPHLTYITVENGRVYTINISYSNSESKNYILAEGLVDRIKYFPPDEKLEAMEDVKGTKDEKTDDGDAKVVAITKPSVVRIFNKYCANLKVSSASGLGNSAGKSYPYCMGALGTGFFINSDGYIATNGHVAKMFGDASLEGAILKGDVDEFLVELIVASVRSQGRSISSQEASTLLAQMKSNPQTFYILFNAVVELYKQRVVTVENEKSDLYVQLGKEPFRVTSTYFISTSANIIGASLVAYDFEDLLQMKDGFKASDVAIIKVTGSNYPALPLGKTEDIKSGSKLIVLGFPGVTDLPMLVDISSTTEPTITRGVVSAIKKAAGDKKTLIQTDASINHGNSGGPAIDSDGNVIGIATYGLTPEDGGGNYNFLRDIEDLKKLMSKKKVDNKTGKTYDLWKTGIEDFWNQRYSKSVTSFKEVSKLYPQHPDSEEFVKEAERKIKNGEDKTNALSKDFVTLATIAASLLVAFISLVVVILLSRRLSRQQKQILAIQH